MTPDDLRKRLGEAGVDPATYRIDDDWNTPLEYIGISPWRGPKGDSPPSGSKWLVFYCERGQRFEVAGFAEWDSASEYFLAWAIRGL